MFADSSLYSAFMQNHIYTYRIAYNNGLSIKLGQIRIQLEKNRKKSDFETDFVFKFDQIQVTSLNFESLELINLVKFNFKII